MLPFNQIIENSLTVFMIKKHILLTRWKFYHFQMLPLNMCSYVLSYQLKYKSQQSSPSRYDKTK